jgi:HEAT repeat protein
MLKYLIMPLLAAAVAVCQTEPAPDKLSHDILDKALQDKNPDTRKNAVIALSLAGAVDPFPAQLDAALDDKDVPVRLAAIASLTDLKNDKTIPALHKALKDPVPEVSFAAARSLWGLNDAEGKTALLSVVSGETKASSGYFAKNKRDAIRMMHTPKTMFMFAIKQGAAFAPVPGLGAGISSMQALLSDPNVSGRATAALLVGRDKDEQTLKALRDAIDDKDWSVRAAVAHSLALRDDPALETDLKPLLEDKSEPVRLRAAAGYLRLEAIKNQPKPAPPKARPRSRRNTTTAPPAAANKS